MSLRCPLAFQQDWLWSLLKTYPEWKCTVAYGVRLRGELVISALRGSVREVVRRHGTLRTRIVSVAGAAEQEIDETPATDLSTVLVQGDSAAEIEATALRMFEEFSTAQLDRWTGPLLSTTLLELSEREHWLLLKVHRLIADCHAVDAVLREILCWYGQELHERRAELSADPIQYADYAVRQREAYPQWQQRHEPYWTRRLDGACALEWPTDARPGMAPRGHLGQMSHRFGESLSTGLRNLARSARTLAPSVMLAVYVATVWRWCRQKDFIIPFYVAGRQSEHKSVVGFFSHILYLRIQITGTETSSQLLGQVAEELFGAFVHQDFGIMATRRPDLLAGTFFQWITWRPEETLADVQPTAVRAEPISSSEFGQGLTAVPPGSVAVEVTFFDTPDGIHASGVYRADLFESNTMELFMADLQSTARQFVLDPTGSIEMEPPIELRARPYAQPG